MASDFVGDRANMERFARNWLEGTTCVRLPRTIHWASEDHRFVLMKHHGHTEYVDRAVGSSRCGTYYALYDLSKPWPNRMGKPCLMMVEGRLLKSHWVDLERLVAEAMRENTAAKD